MNLIFLSGACIINNDQVLLVQQSQTARHKGLWGPPAGHKKGRETMFEIAIREVKEETNLDIEVKGLVQSGIIMGTNGKISVFTLYFAFPKNTQKIKTDDPKISDYKWVTLEEVKKDKYPLRNPLLKSVLIKALTQKSSPIDSFNIY
jgi:8-oxo-dGTP pyrophosphatase MutT (NUDIX family)